LALVSAFDEARIKWIDAQPRDNFRVEADLIVSVFFHYENFWDEILGFHRRKICSGTRI